MRISGLMFFMPLMLASTAMAQVTDEQIESAKAVFLGGPSAENSDYAAQYRNHLLVGLDGSWIPALFFPAEKYAEACERRTIDIVVDSPFTFQMEHGVGGSRQRTVSFFNRLGSQFVQVSDPLESAEFFGFDPTNEREFARLEQTMPISNQKVQVFRPSPDVLVVQVDGLKPEIYARCPVQ